MFFATFGQADCAVRSRFTCRRVLSRRFGGAGPEDELTVLADLHLAFHRWISGVPSAPYLERRIPHMTHLDAEWKLVT